MIEKRRSRIHGSGVYAIEPIAKNKRIIHYAGEKISNRESLKRELRYIRKGHIWCFKLTNRTVIDAGVGGNIARFINHSCRPNCYIDIKEGVIWIRAARSIRRGEELTYDYNTDGEGLIKCRCRPRVTSQSRQWLVDQQLGLHGHARDGIGDFVKKMTLPPGLRDKM